MRRWLAPVLVFAAGVLPAAAQNVFQPLPVGESAGMTIVVSIPNEGTLESIELSTGGVPNLDFSDDGGGSCTVGINYAANSTCTVAVRFAPHHAGAAYGAAILTFNSSFSFYPTFALAYLQGIGMGPQITFPTGEPIGIGSDPNPVAAWVDESDHIFVADAAYGGGFSLNGSLETWAVTNDRIRLIEPNLQFLFSIQDPSNVTVDGAGIVAVDQIETGRQTQVPQPGGEYQPDPGGPGGGAAVDGAGNFYTTSCGAKPYFAGIPGGDSKCPDSIAVDGRSTMYIAIYGMLYMETPQPDGSYHGERILAGLPGISKAAVDGMGNIYLTANHRLYRETLLADGSYRQTELPNSFTEPEILSVGLNEVMVVDNNTGVIHRDASVWNFAPAQAPLVHFENTPKASSSAPRTLIVSNAGNSPLTLSGLSYPQDFPEAPGGENPCTASTTLAQGESCELSFRFRPHTTGLFDEQLVLTDNHLNVEGSEQAIQLRGTGVQYEANDSSIHVSLAASKITYPQSTVAAVVVAAMARAEAPTGSVQLLLDGRQMAARQTLAASGDGRGAVQFSIESPGVGMHRLTAYYAGDLKNPAGYSQDISLEVLPAPVRLTASCTAAGLIYGQNLHCKVYTDPTLAGFNAVIAYRYDHSRETWLPLHDGTATLTIDKPSLGSHTVQIFYPAQGNYASTGPWVENFTVTAPHKH